MEAVPFVIFRSVIDRSEIDLLVSRSAKREAHARWVSGLLERGESRLRWCRMALSDDGELLAAQAMYSWSFDRDPGDTPALVHLLGHVDEAAAAALLSHDLRAFGAATVDARLVSVDARLVSEAGGSGFTIEVDRVLLHRPESLPMSSGPGPVPHRAGGRTPADVLREAPRATAWPSAAG
jgi:hypothetical protein